MNVPNKLTSLRILLIPVFLFALYSMGRWSEMIALAIFVFAAVTDYLDGYLARKHKMVTTFGKFADPLADKLLVAAALVAFVDLGFMGIYGGIIAIIVISREFIVTGLRLVAVSGDKIISAHFWGKLKTVLQIASIISILLRANQTIMPRIFENIHPSAQAVFGHFTYWLIIVMTIVTIVSGVAYIWKNAKLIKVD